MGRDIPVFREGTRAGTLKISSTGWLCVWDRGEWIAVFKLTEEQIREYRAMRPEFADQLGEKP